MIVLKPITTSQTIKFIPREFSTNLTLNFTDDITLTEITPSTSTVTQVGDFINVSFTITGFKEARFYTLRVEDSSDEVVYKDKCFVTNQGVDQTQEQKYTINKDVYQPKSTGDNDYIVL